MVYLGVLLGIAIMAAMITMAVNKKSTFIVRVASLIAIALMILAIIVCLFIVFTDNRVPVDESVLIVGAPVEVNQEGGGNSMVLLLLIIILLALFALIAVSALKEHRKAFPKSKIQDSTGSVW